MPFRASEGRIPAGSDTDESVRASIERIIHTRLGERPMRPGVGSRTWDFAFENVGATTVARIRAEVRRSISTQEPRVRVLAVSVTSYDDLPDSPGKSGYRIDVTYRLSGQVQTMSTELDPESSA